MYFVVFNFNKRRTFLWSSLLLGLSNLSAVRPRFKSVPKGWSMQNLTHENRHDVVGERVGGGGFREGRKKCRCDLKRCTYKKCLRKFQTEPHWVKIQTVKVLCHRKSFLIVLGLQGLAYVIHRKVLVWERIPSRRRISVYSYRFWYV